MEEIRIWLSSENSVNIVTNIGVEGVKAHLKSFKQSLKPNEEVTESKLEQFLKVNFGLELVIIPREIEEIEFSEV